MYVGQNRAGTIARTLSRAVSMTGDTRWHRLTAVLMSCLRPTRGRLHSPGKHVYAHHSDLRQDTAPISQNCPSLMTDSFSTPSCRETGSWVSSPRSMRCIRPSDLTEVEHGHTSEVENQVPVDPYRPVHPFNCRSYADYDSPGENAEYSWKRQVRRNGLFLQIMSNVICHCLIVVSGWSAPLL